MIALVTVLALAFLLKRLYYSKNKEQKPDERDYSISQKASYITMNIFLITLLIIDYLIIAFKDSQFVINNNLYPVSNALSLTICGFTLIYFVTLLIIKKKGK